MSRELAPPRAPAREVASEVAVSAAKAVFAVIPWIGGLLDEVVFEARGRLKQQRVNQLVTELADEIRRLDESAIDREFLGTEAFSDLLEDIFRRAAQSRGEVRREAFRNVLVNAVQGKYDPDFAALFASILSEISEAEIALLRRFGRIDDTAQRDFGGGSGRTQRFDYNEAWWGCPPNVARQIVQALVARSLLADTSFGRANGPTPFAFIDPTELGTRFLDWLTAKGAPIVDDRT